MLVSNLPIYYVLTTMVVLEAELAEVLSSNRYTIHTYVYIWYNSKKMSLSFSFTFIL